MFNIEKFQDTQFKDNTVDVKVPNLKAFFGKDEKAIWKVRALTGHELAKVNEAIKLNKDVSELIEGLSSNNSSDKISSIKKVIGISEDAPDDLVRRISILLYGSIEPVLTQEIAVKLADVYPTQFWQLTNEILSLTGAGKLGE